MSMKRIVANVQTSGIAAAARFHGDLGFKTPSHFTCHFRREFAVTPSSARSLRG